MPFEKIQAQRNREINVDPTLLIDMTGMSIKNTTQVLMNRSRSTFVTEVGRVQNSDLATR